MKGVYGVYEEASSRFEGVLSAPRAPRTLGRSPDESGWRGRRVGGRNHAVGGRRSRLSRPKWRWWCLIHRADDPSFDVSVAWAHWASTPRSAAVRAAVGSLPALVTSRRATDSVRRADSHCLAAPRCCRPRLYHCSNRWVPGRRASNRGYLRAH